MKKIIFILLLLSFFSCIAQKEIKNVTAQEFQEQLNKKFANADSSPLLEEDLKHFKTLDFYPISDIYKVQATLTKIKNGEVFEMKTTTSRKPKYKVFGIVHFQIEGKNYELKVYQNIELKRKKEYKKHLFLPFTDYTNGVETYGAGRYIDLQIPENNIITLDFNKAYNPYCAYNKNYSCPIVPEENDLKVEIKAGVKKFHD